MLKFDLFRSQHYIYRTSKREIRVRILATLLVGFFGLLSSFQSFAQISCHNLFPQHGLVLFKGTPVATSSRELELTAYQKAVRDLRDLPANVRELLVETFKAQLKIYSQSALPSAAMLMALDVPLEQVQEIVRAQLQKTLQRVPTRSGNLKLTFDVNVESPQPTTKGVQESAFMRKWGVGKYIGLISRVENELLPQEYAQLGAYSANYRHQFDTIGFTRLAKLTQALGMHEETRTLAQILLTHEEMEDYSVVANELRDDRMLFQGALYRLALFYSKDSHRYFYNNLYASVVPLRLLKDPKLRSDALELTLDLAAEIASPEFKERIEKDSKTSSHVKGDITGSLARYASSLLEALSGLGESIRYYKPEDSVKFFLVTSSNDMRVRRAIRQLIDLSEGHDIGGWEGTENKIIRLYLTTNDRERLTERAVHFEKLAKERGDGPTLTMVKYRLAAGDFPTAYKYLLSYLKKIHKKTGLLQILSVDQIAQFDFSDLASISAQGGMAESFLGYLKSRLPEKAYAWVEQTFRKELKDHVNDTTRLWNDYRRDPLEAYVVSNYYEAFIKSEEKNRTTAEEDLQIGMRYSASGNRIDLVGHYLLSYAFKRGAEKDKSSPGQ